MQNNRHDWVGKIQGNTDELFFILGPCAIESEKHCLMLAEKIKQISEQLNVKVIFKASFDKANRTSINSFRSVGIDKGLEVLARVRHEFAMPVTTDVHEAWQMQQVGDVVDVIQIPAFLCRQTDLLVAAGNTGKPVNIKKGQFVRPEKMDSAVKKVASTNNKNIWLCERGYTFGYEDLIVDYRNFSHMKALKCPIVFDATHSVQRPGQLGVSTGGDRRFVPQLSAAAVIQGIAGVFMEVHDNPDNALSDGPNSVPLSQLENLIRYLIDLDTWSKSKPIPEVR